MRQIKFQGTSAKEILRRTYSVLAKLSSFQIGEYKNKLISLEIITIAEFGSISNAIDLLLLLYSREDQQVEEALSLIYEDSVNEGPRTAIDSAIQELSRRQGTPTSNCSQTEVLIPPPAPSSSLAKAANNCPPISTSRKLNWYYKIMGVGLVLVVFLAIIKLSPSSPPVFNIQQNNGHSIVNSHNPQSTGPQKPTENGVSVNVQHIYPEKVGDLLPQPKNILTSDQQSTPSTVRTPTYYRRSVPTPTLVAPFPKNSRELEDFESAKLISTFIPLGMRNFSLDSVKSMRHYKSGLCNESVNKALILHNYEPFHPSDLKIHCPELVDGLQISGNLTLANIHQLLTTFTRLQYLIVDLKDICPTIDNNLEQLLPVAYSEKVILSQLKFLKLSNKHSECIDFVDYISRVEAENLETLVLENYTISISTIDATEELINKSPKLSALSYDEGELCLHCSLFQKSQYKGNLTALLFNPKQDLIVTQAPLESLKALIPKDSNNTLKYFVSSVDIPIGNWSNIFSNFRTVRILNATLDLSESPQFIFNVKLITKFPYLREGSFHFNHKTKKGGVCERVKVINLKIIEKMRVHSLTFKSSCRPVNVKNWRIHCRNYFQKVEGDLIYVIIAAQEHYDDCKAFWGT